MPADSASPAQQASDMTEEDSLGSLEERIHRAVELVSALRAERDGAIAESQKLREELEALRSERKQARTRIEKLLRQMESL